MQVLVIESRPESQDKLLEVLSWFYAIKRVMLATVEEEIAHHHTAVEAVIVGCLPRLAHTEVVRDVRRKFPTARIVAAIDGETPPDADSRLKAAGADSVLDVRFSIWKTGVTLREILWQTPEATQPSGFSTVPGLQVETV